MTSSTNNSSHLFIQQLNIVEVAFPFKWNLWKSPICRTSLEFLLRHQWRLLSRRHSVQLKLGILILDQSRSTVSTLIHTSIYWFSFAFFLRFKYFFYHLDYDGSIDMAVFHSSGIANFYLNTNIPRSSEDFCCILCKTLTLDFSNPINFTVP